MATLRVPSLLLACLCCTSYTRAKESPSTALSAYLLSSNPAACFSLSLPHSHPGQPRAGRSGRISCLIKGEVDEEAMFAASSFPIAPAALIERAKEVLSEEVGVGTKDGGACLAPDFEFCAAVVGPIGRDAYLNALGTFKLEDAFPDLNPQYYGFRVDPFEPHRVWFHSRSVATHTGSLMGKPATGKKLTLPPQLFHLDFNEQGLVREIGFYVVDRRQGNTGGLGGAFGYFYGTGNPLPVPECQPYKPSKRFRFLNFLGRLQSRFKKKSSKKE